MRSKYYWKLNKLKTKLNYLFHKLNINFRFKTFERDLIMTGLYGELWSSDIYISTVTPVNEK